MNSPIKVTDEVVVLAKVNYNRDEIVLQNTGEKDVFIKKILPGKPDVVPSNTSYDYVLKGTKQHGNDDKSGNGNDNKQEEYSELKLTSIARFLAVTESGCSHVAVMETIKL